MSNVLLQTNHLSKIYPGGTEALKNVSLTFKQGELVSIIGPSGAGKSTFLRSINLLNQPSAGEVIFKGKDITKAKGKELLRVRREIGMIFQDFNLIKRSSTVRNVLHGRLGYMSSFKGAFGMFSEREVKDALAILKRVGLEDHAFKRADELSGGQQQRVGIARAINQEPELILADEPIASLDPSSSANVMNYLKTICVEDDMTAIVNLHQVDVAKQFAERIIGIRNGEVVFDGKPSELTSAMINHIYDQQEGVPSELTS